MGQNVVYRSRSDSEDESASSSPSCSRVDTSYPIPTPSCSTVDHDIVSDSVPKTCPISSSFCIDHGWINNLYITNELPPLPEFVADEPYWREMEREFIGLHLRDANVSKDLEESNTYMYSLRLTLAAMEEARWLNDVSKDPELSRLVHEIDPQFPIAVNGIPESLGSDGSSSIDVNEASGDCPSDMLCPTLEIKDDFAKKPAFFRSMRRPSRRLRVAHNTVTGSPSRKPKPTWSEVASAALERWEFFFSVKLFVVVPTIGYDPSGGVPVDPSSAAAVPQQPIMRGGMRGRGRGGPATGRFPQVSSNRGDGKTLQVKKIPPELNNIAKLNEHFATFGSIVNMQVRFNGEPDSALISYASRHEAMAAYKSPQPVLNNRFIKVFFYNPDVVAGSAIGQDGVQRSVLNSGVNVDKPASEGAPPPAS